MKMSKTLKYTLFSFCLMPLSSIFSVEILLKEKINIQGNNVGLHEDDQCFVTHPTFGAHEPVVAKEITINCKNSKKTFEDVGFIVGSSTGTPPNIIFKNIIGCKPYHSNIDAHKPGYNKRIFFCEGPCELRAEKE